MPYYMLIILREQQLDIGPYYLIYNSENSNNSYNSTILKSTKDVRQLFYACYPKSFRLKFQTIPQYDPAWPSGLISSPIIIYAH